jgi:hypothetical protein
LGSCGLVQVLPWGAAVLGPSRCQVGTGPVWHRDGGVPDREGESRIGAGWTMGCIGMVQVIAAGSLCARFSELTLTCDEAAGLEVLEGAQNCASAGARFGHQRANRRVAGEALVGLVGEQDEDQLHDGLSDVRVSGPVEGFPAHVAGIARWPVSVGLPMRRAVVRRSMLRTVGLLDSLYDGHFRLC